MMNNTQMQNKKNTTKKTWSPERICSLTAAVMTLTAVMVCPASAANTFDAVVRPVVTLINDLIGPILGIVGAVGTLYCILLGVKFAKAEEPQEREKAKGHLKNAIIGFVLIFVLMVVLNLSMKPLMDWVNKSAGTNISITSTTAN